MTTDEAFKRAIKKYFKGKEPDEYNKAVGERKFTKKYLDGLMEEFTGKDKKEHE